MVADFDFDVEFEEEFLKSTQPKKEEHKKVGIPEIKVRGAKAAEIKAEKDQAAKEAVPEKIIEPQTTQIFTLRTTANREEQVMDFISANVTKKKIQVYSVVHPHGMRGYIFVEAESQSDVEQAIHGIPYAKGLIGRSIPYTDIEHMFEQHKVQANIKKNDIVEIISGPFKREKAKVTRIDHTKEDVVVELLDAAVPIPITVKFDAVKVIRSDGEAEE